MSDAAIDYDGAESLVELLQMLRERGVPKEQFWMHVSHYQDRTARMRGIPLHGLFELTPLCNLDCKMCYVHMDSSLVCNKDLLSPEDWMSIMRQARSMGMSNATLTGGECLTYPFFEEVYLFLRDLGIQPHVKTNGVMLSGDRLDFFMRHRPKSINVSLYGSSNETYEKVTGYPVFDIVYENLLRLKEAHFPVSVSITPSVYMRDDLTATFDVARRLDLPLTYNIMLFKPREETGRELRDLSVEEYLDIEKTLRADSLGGVLPLNEADLPECGVGNGEPEYGIRCGAGRSTFNVNWHGFLTACENLSAKRVSLLDYSFADAWYLVHEDALLYPLPVECSDCPYDKVCLSCVAYRCNGAETGHVNPEVCKRTRLSVQYGIRSF